MNPLLRGFNARALNSDKRVATKRQQIRFLIIKSCDFTNSETGIRDWHLMILLQCHFSGGCPQPPPFRGVIIFFENMDAEFRVWRGAAFGSYVPPADEMLNNATLPGLTVVIRITMICS